MSRDGLSEMEALDRLGDELAAAGRVARTAAAVRAVPAPGLPGVLPRLLAVP